MIKIDVTDHENFKTSTFLAGVKPLLTCRCVVYCKPPKPLSERPLHPLAFRHSAPAVLSPSQQPSRLPRPTSTHIPPSFRQRCETPRYSRLRQAKPNNRQCKRFGCILADSNHDLREDTKYSHTIKLDTGQGKSGEVASAKALERAGEDAVDESSASMR
jgi:hypothetical protein